MTNSGTERPVEATDLRSLVAHRSSIPASSTVEEAQAKLRASDVDFMAVIDDEKLVGVCAQRELGHILGSRYGYSLYAHRHLVDFLMAAPLRLKFGLPLTEVFKAASDRAPREFYDDAVLLDEAGRYAGMIPIRAIVRLQTEYLLRNISALEASRREIAEKNDQMESDLAMAREVQLAMLPRQSPAAEPSGGPLEFAHRYRPAGTMSGDFFDVIRLPNGSAGVFICDVMGHGVRSALITAMIRAMLEQLQAFACKPGEFLTRLNRDLTHILRQAGGLIFVTAAYAVFDLESAAFKYAQAGHPSPIRLHRADGSVRPVRCPQEASGPALGFIDDFIYAGTDEPLAVGDRWLLFTDGVTEAPSQSGDEFGLDRLMASFAGGGSRPLPGALDDVMNAVNGFCAVPTLSDDVCLVGVEFNGRNAN